MAPFQAGVAGAMLNQPQTLASGITWLPVTLANVFFLGEPNQPWILVDTGTAGSGKPIRRAAEHIYGNTPPHAIVLTHAHFDHAGSAQELADVWNVPIYVHELEVPYVAGKSDYPPQDPTVGGVFAQMSRVFPHHGYNFGERVRVLPPNGSLPGTPEWLWIHVPGHTAGQIALFRERDRVLLAADALVTMNQNNLVPILTQKPVFFCPPPYLTTDWNQARQSVEQLAMLEPNIVASGHGRPINRHDTALESKAFAGRFTPPEHGRYVQKPAVTTEQGVLAVPPPAPDPLPKQLAIAGAVLAGIVLARGRRSRRAFRM